MAEEFFLGGFVARLIAVVNGIVVLEKKGGEVGRGDFGKVGAGGATGWHGMAVGEAGAPESGEIVGSGGKNSKAGDGFGCLGRRSAAAVV